MDFYMFATTTVGSLKRGEFFITQHANKLFGFAGLEGANCICVEKTEETIPASCCQEVDGELADDYQNKPYFILASRGMKLQHPHIQLIQIAWDEPKLHNEVNLMQLLVDLQLSLADFQAQIKENELPEGDKLPWDLILRQDDGKWAVV